MSVHGTVSTASGGAGEGGFGRRSTAADVTRSLDLGGRTVLVTGCGSGLGLETMRVLCARGARVVGAARTLESAASACDRMEGRAIPVACDLSEPASVLAAVARIRELGFALDAVIANAGVMAPPRLEQKYGYEIQFFTNHVGHHLLVTRLLDRLSDTGRVVVLSSSAHRRAPPEGIRFGDLSGEKAYSPRTAYGQSKLANLLFAKHLAARLPKAGQTANAVHPGVIRTNLQRHLGVGLRAVFSTLGPLFMKTVPQGAATQCYVAVHPAAASVRGEYFADCNVARPSRLARDAALAAQLWERTERIIASVC
jgi:WW domain-containing oxidoreductase